MSGSFYRPRAIEQTFTDHASHQVAILEGRRAIGKSTLARHLVDTGIYASYQTLADPTERANAATDPTRWLTTRSEERRVGKECRSRWSPYH